MAASGDGYERAKLVDVTAVNQGGSDEEYETDDDEVEIAAGKEQMRVLTEIATGDDSDVIMHDTPNDAWGVFIFVIVRDIGDLSEGEFSVAHAFRIVFSFVAMFLNLFLQFAVLYWVFEYVVTPGVEIIQMNYADFHRICFDKAGAFDSTACDKFSSSTKQNLCQAGLSQPIFLCGILFLWTLAMLVEFRENFNLHRHLRALSNLPKGVSRGDQVLEQKEGGETNYLMVALCPITRGILYALVVVPKYFIIMFLTFIGWRWLSSSESFEDLILNSLALQFIVTIDELIFSAVFPESMVERIERLKLAVPKPQYESKEEKEKAKDNDTIYYYSQAACFLFLAIGLLGFYITVFQNVLPGYEYDLNQVCHKAAGTSFHCKFMAKDCFPKGPPARLLSVSGLAEV